MLDDLDTALAGFGPLDKDVIDTLARGVCQRVAEGSMDEDSARTHLSALVYRSRMPADTVNAFQMEWASNAAQVRQDALEALVELMVRKCRDGLDLARIAGGASFSGWVHQLCRAAMTTVVRGLRRSYARCYVGPEAIEDHPEVTAMAAEDTCGYDLFAAAASGFADVAQQRKSHRLAMVQARSRALCLAYGLPEPTRLSTGRDEAVAELDDDPRAALAVVTDLACGRADSPLAAVFEAFSRHDLELLACKPAMVADAIARAAVSDRLPLPAAVVKQLRSELAAHLGMADDARSLAVKTVLAWARATATMEWTGRTTVEPKTDEQVATDEAHYAYQASLLLRHTGSFSTADDLSRWLTARADAAMMPSLAQVVA